MGNEDLEGTAVYLHRGLQESARLAESRQWMLAGRENTATSQQQVAELPAESTEAGPKVGGEPGPARELRWLVGEAGLPGAPVHFLQRHDVWILFHDQARHLFEVSLVEQSGVALDVVGEDLDRRGRWLKWLR